jgi:hypothetical protein
MTRWLLALTLLVIPLGCSSSSNTLTGSLSTVYDLSFNSVVIVLEGSNVQIMYVGDSGDPAVLVVNTANIADVVGTEIDLTQLEAGQARGVLQMVGGGTAMTTQQFGINNGFVTFNSVPKVGQVLSGSFAATLTNPMGLTLDGTFSAKVNAP